MQKLLRTIAKNTPAGNIVLSLHQLVGKVLKLHVTNLIKLRTIY